jgi:hypothetical protein
MEDADGNMETMEEGEIPPEIAAQVRSLLHDLSNALEIVVQTQYLLSTVADPSGPSKEWLGLLDHGTQQAINVNRELREYIRSHSE